MAAESIGHETVLGETVPTPAVGTPPRAWLILAVVSVAQFMVLLDATVVNVALPRMALQLRISSSLLPWILDAYAVTFGGLLLLGGRVADLAGRRRVFLAGLLTFVAASLACGLSTNTMALVVARAAQGIAAGFLSPAALSIVTATFTHGPRRHTALSIWGGLGGLGATVGVVMGGLVVSSLGWPWAFFVNLPLGLTAAALALWLVPHGRPETRAAGRRHLDLLGATTVTLGLLLLVLSTVSVREFGWTAPLPLGCAAGAALLLVAFVVIERRAAAPMLPSDVVGDRTLRVGSIGQFLVGATQLSAMFLISMEAQRQLKMDPLRAGLSFVPVGLAAVCAALAASLLVGRIGLRGTYALASGSGLVGLVLFAQLSGAGPGSYLRAMFGPSLLVGIALPMASVVGTIIGTWQQSEIRAGLASGVLNSSFQVGSALGLAVAATLAVDRLRDGYLATAVFEAFALINAAIGMRRAFVREPRVVG
jgi:MFS family permease